MHVNIIRVEDKHVIIVQAKHTKSIWKVHLHTPIPIEHMAIARTISPFNALAAEINLGAYNDREFLFEGSEITSITWPQPVSTCKRKIWF